MRVRKVHVYGNDIPVVLLCGRAPKGAWMISLVVYLAELSLGLQLNDTVCQNCTKHVNPLHVLANTEL